jgi:hypothetical protein
VGVFSLEMRAEELGLKLLSAEPDSATRCARAGQLSSQHWRDLYTAVRRIAGACLGVIRRPDGITVVPLVPLWSEYVLPRVEGVTQDGLLQPL